MNKKLFAQEIVCEEKPNRKPTYVKLNRDINGVVSFETTFNKKEEVSLKELKRIYE